MTITVSLQQFISIRGTYPGLPKCAILRVPFCGIFAHNVHTAARNAANTY